MVNKYLGIIHRNDLNILFKRGYIVLCSAHMKDISGYDNVTEKNVSDLLHNISPFDYTSEYVFIKFVLKKKWWKKDNINNIEYKDVMSIIPLDLIAKKDMEMSFNKMIKFEEPLWHSCVENFSQILFKENMERGASACLEILDAKVNKPINDLGDENLIAKFTNIQFQKDKLDENSTIWQYLLMYDRHEPYPDNNIGYFYDSVHVFVNFISKKECLSISPVFGGKSPEVLKSLEWIEQQKVLGFENIICELEKNEYAKKYIEKCTQNDLRQYILLPIYFFLLNLLSSTQNYQTIAKIAGENMFVKLYKKEYGLAVYLVGLRLGFDSINEIYYQNLDKRKVVQQSLF